MIREIGNRAPLQAEPKRLFSTVAVVLAGGVGSRAGAALPKQYVEVAGAPIVVHTLRAFEVCSPVEAIVVVAAKEWRAALYVWLEEFKLSKVCSVAPAGATRQESVLSGLRAASGIIDADGIIIIHDAARPLVSAALIESVVTGCAEHDGCMPVLGVTDTMYLSSDGKSVSGLLDRSQLFAGQSPEAFAFTPYYKVNRDATASELSACRGSSEIAFTAGLDIAIVPGDPANYKITTAQDIERFKAAMEGAGI